MTTTTNPNAAIAAEIREERDERLGAIITATAGALADAPGAAEVQFRATGTGSGWVATDLTSRQHAYVVVTIAKRWNRCMSSPRVTLTPCAFEAPPAVDASKTRGTDASDEADLSDRSSWL